MSLTDAAWEYLQWWKDSIMTACRNIRHPSIAIACIFQTDASLTGWGITCTTDDTLQSQGLLTQEKTSLHINVRELLACNADELNTGKVRLLISATFRVLDLPRSTQIRVVNFDWFSFLSFYLIGL